MNGVSHGIASSNQFRLPVFWGTWWNCKGTCPTGFELVVSVPRDVVSTNQPTFSCLLRDIVELYGMHVCDNRITRGSYKMIWLLTISMVYSCVHMRGTYIGLMLFVSVRYQPLIVHEMSSMSNTWPNSSRLSPSVYFLHIELNLRGGWEPGSRLILTYTLM